MGEFQASAATKMICVLFCDIMQRIMQQDQAIQDFLLGFLDP